MLLCCLLPVWKKFTEFDFKMKSQLRLHKCTGSTWSWFSVALTCIIQI